MFSRQRKEIPVVGYIVVRISLITTRGRELAAMSSKSEVARLRERIERELEAMQRGLHGLAQGTARHDFILARLDRVGTFQDKLADQIGYPAATEVVCQLYVQVMENDMASSSGTPSPASG